MLLRNIHILDISAFTHFQFFLASLVATFFAAHEKGGGQDANAQEDANTDSCLGARTECRIVSPVISTITTIASVILSIIPGVVRRSCTVILSIV